MPAVIFLMNLLGHNIIKISKKKKTTLLDLIILYRFFVPTNYFNNNILSSKTIVANVIDNININFGEAKPKRLWTKVIIPLVFMMQ